MNKPILSICIPTYERGSSLSKLLYNLEDLIASSNQEIEICISDNASEDDTQSIVAEFSARIPIEYVRQATNIGATKNLLAVSSLAKGQWVVMIGDDDLIEKDVALELVSLLKQLPGDDWVLIEAAHGGKNETYFSSIPGGRYNNYSFLRYLLLEGVQPLSFMGVHVFPNSGLAAIQGLSMAQLRPWPHISAFLRFLSQRKAAVTIIRRPLVRQAGGAESLFWNAADLARMQMDKMRIINKVRVGGVSFRLFLVILMVCEAYRRNIFAGLVAWRIYEPESFRVEGLIELSRRVLALRLFGPILLPHLALVGVLTLMPTAFINGMLRLLGHGHKRREYLDTKARIGQYDALKRGL